MKLTLGSNRQPYGTMIGLNFLTFCLSGNPGTDCKSWICIAGGAKKHFLEDNEEKNYFIVSALNSCCGGLKKSGSKTLWLVGAEKVSNLY